MKNDTKIIFISGVFSILILAVVFVGFGMSDKKDAGNEQLGLLVAPFSSYASSSSALITTSSKMVAATNTARTSLEIANIAGKPIYCNLSRGAPAVMYKGLTIFASTTRQIFTQDNPYTGAVHCIAEANASTTIIEK